MTRRMSAILGEYCPAGQGCTRHFSVPPLEYKNSTSYKKYRPDFGLNIQESYGKRPIFEHFFMLFAKSHINIFLLVVKILFIYSQQCQWFVSSREISSREGRLVWRTLTLRVGIPGSQEQLWRVKG